MPVAWYFPLPHKNGRGKSRPCNDILNFLRVFSQNKPSNKPVAIRYQPIAMLRAIS